MKRLLFLFITFLTFSQLSFAQSDTICLNFQSTFNNEAMELDKSYFLPSINDSVTINAFRFYISDIQFFKADKISYEIAEKAFLIDANTKSKVIFETDSVIEYDAIKFNIGIDSVTNVSGALGGDLDPVKGMYWAWQSGYINFKLEGKSLRCKTRNNLFQYHIGGYLPPYASVKSVSFSISDKSSLNLQFDVSKFLDQVDISTLNVVMSPSTKAVKLANQYQSLFSIKE